MASAATETVPAPGILDPAFAPLRGRIPSLDGLRAISIALVLALHATNAWALGHGAKADYHGFLFPLINGSLGVSIFFGISGFLITHLMLRERAKTGTISLRNFYIRRFFRILPAYWLFLATVIVLQRMRVIGLPTHDIVKAALFVFDYGNGSPWVGHCWSLSVEEQFYLFWPLLLWLLGPWAGRRIAVGFLLVVPVIRIAEILLLGPTNTLVETMWKTGHTRMDTIMFGAAIALFYNSPRFHRLIHFVFTWRLHWAAFAFLFAVSPYLYLRWGMLYLGWGGFSLEGVCILLLIVWAVQHDKTLVGRLLNCRPIVHVGLISYSLYLWQEMFLLPLNTSWTGRLPMNLLCAVAMAELSHFGVERPFLLWRERFVKGAHRTAEAALPASAVSA